MTTRHNGNGHFQSPKQRDGSLRAKILSLLADHDITTEHACRLLRQCAAHLENQQLIRKITKSCKVELSGFGVNDDLEIYYDLSCGRRELGFISKGWDDPGFRIGEVIAVPPDWKAKLKASITEIRRIAATNGLGLSIERGRDTTDVMIDGVIYSEGFNRMTFKKTLTTLRECVEKIKDLLDGR